MTLHPSLLTAASLLALALPAAQAAEPEALASFSGAIGVDPLTAAGGNLVPNVVRNTNPGGRAWAIRKLRASIGADGSIRAKGEGLVFASGETIGTAGAVTAVGASLFCGAAGAAVRYDSAIVPLDAYGNFSIRGTLSQDGIHTATLPATCTAPVLLIRSGNGGVLGGWFAAGIPAPQDD